MFIMASYINDNNNNKAKLIIVSEMYRNHQIYHICHVTETVRQSDHISVCFHL